MPEVGSPDGQQQRTVERPDEVHEVGSCATNGRAVKDREREEEKTVERVELRDKLFDFANSWKLAIVFLVPCCTFFFLACFSIVIGLASRFLLLHHQNYGKFTRAP